MRYYNVNVRALAEGPEGPDGFFGRVILLRRAAADPIRASALSSIMEVISSSDTDMVSTRFALVTEDGRDVISAWMFSIMSSTSTLARVSGGLD